MDDNNDRMRIMLITTTFAQAFLPTILILQGAQFI